MRGLEFDHVVVVEPLQLLADPDLALRALYVALTRATQRVSMHASEKCPSWLVSSGVEIRNDRLSSDEAVINL
jgi:ATP-dependent exoDNAse (exonuclease V) alpha subunit